MEGESSHKKHKSDKKIHFIEDEVKEHEEGHVIKEASDKFVKWDDSDVLDGDEIG